MQVISLKREMQEGSEESALMAGGDMDKVSALPCPQCGSIYSIEKNTLRLRVCAYCGSSVVIPGKIWQRLHPVPVREQWFIRFEGISIQEKQYQKVQENAKKIKMQEAAKNEERYRENIARKKRIFRLFFGIFCFAFLYKSFMESMEMILAGEDIWFFIKLAVFLFIIIKVPMVNKPKPIPEQDKNK